MRIKRDYMGNDQLIPAYNFQAAISFLASGSLLAVFFHIFFEACNLPGKGLSVCISQGRCQSCHILFNLGRVIRNIQGKIAECAYLLKIQIRIRLLMAVSAHVVHGNAVCCLGICTFLADPFSQIIISSLNIIQESRDSKGIM